MLLRRKISTTDRSFPLLLAFILTAALLIRAVPLAYADGGLSTRYDKIASSVASVTTTHAFGLQYTNMSTALGSVSLEFCSNDPLPNTPCTQPSGLDLTSAQLVNQTGETGFTIHANSTVNRIILTRSAAVPFFAGVSTYQFDQVLNPDTPGSYYVRLQTYSSTDASGTDIENGGVVFAINRALSVAAEVPPYLKLCVAVTIDNLDCSTATSFLTDMGEFIPSRTTKTSSQLVVATNASFGFSISIAGTTLTSGNHVIPARTSPGPAAPNSSQFGMNLRANIVPVIGADPAGSGGTGSITGNYNLPNQYMYHEGDTLITSPTTSDNQKFTTSYIVNVNSAQASGFYATTFSYICLANF
jgi:hypothetical protein